MSFALLLIHPKGTQNQLFSVCFVLHSPEEYKRRSRHLFFHSQVSQAEKK